MSTKFQFKKATKKQVKARVAIAGPSGSGKTYTGLVASTALANGGRIAVIDTERGSASLYSDYFSFDVLELEPPFSPKVYKQAIKAAEDAGYGVILIDSLSHAWEGEGGALDLADEATSRQRTPNSYTAWREVTPLHREMVDAMLQSKAHIVATMRSKTEYAIQKEDGKTKILKVGMAPIQRAGMEYEFTVVGDMDIDNKIVISKSRFAPLQSKVQLKPDINFFKPFVDWLNSGDAEVKAEPTKPTPQKEQPLTQAELSAAVQDTRTANGDKWARPMKPAVLKEALEKKYAVSKPATEKQVATARILLLNYFGDREDERHQATEYLTGYRSTKDVKPEQWRAIMDWMKPEKNPDGSGGYIMNADAQAELSMVASQFMAELGQESLL